MFPTGPHILLVSPNWRPMRDQLTNHDYFSIHHFHLTFYFLNKKICHIRSIYFTLLAWYQSQWVVCLRDGLITHPIVAFLLHCIILPCWECCAFSFTGNEGLWYNPRGGSLRHDIIRDSLFLRYLVFIYPSNRDKITAHLSHGYLAIIVWLDEYLF